MFSTLTAFTQQTLKLRIRLWAGTIVAILALGIMGSFYIIEKNNRVADVKSHLQQIIDLQSLYIEQWTHERTNDINRIAISKDAQEQNLASLDKEFKSYLNVNSDYSLLFFVDKSGHTKSANPDEVPFYLGDREYFHMAQNGRGFISGVRYSEIAGYSLISISSPVYNTQDEFIGAIVGIVKLKTLDELMKGHNFGKTGELYVIDDQGNIVAKSKVVDEKNESRRMSTPIVMRALLQKTDFSPYEGYQGRTVYGTYKWSNDNRWIIIGEISKQEVLENVYQILYTFIVITLIVLVVSLGAVFILTSWIEKPIYRLLKGTKIVRSGNYNYQISLQEMKYAPIELRMLCEANNETTTKLKETIHLLEQSALNDQLTEIHNRRYVMNEGSKLLEVSMQMGQTCSVIMTDIDRFKKINDTYGHLIGDRVLRHIAALLNQEIGYPLIVARYGGEEFILIALNADAALSLQLAEELRKRIIAIPYTDKQYTIPITVSMGVAELSVYPQYGTTMLEDAISRADRALYQAKTAGRNRIVVDPKSGLESIV